MSQMRRRRQLKAKGRIFTLSRGSLSFEVLGYAPPPTSATLDTSLSRQPLIVQIGFDEISCQPDYKSPRNGDHLRDNGRLYTLTDASAVYSKSALIGWVLIAAGGS